MRKFKPLLLAVVFMLLACLVVGVWAHGGGLDSYGGHHNRKAGGYLFHRGSLAGQHFSDKNTALTALRKQQTKTSSQPVPADEAPPAQPAAGVIMTTEQRLQALEQLLLSKGLITSEELVAYRAAVATGK